MQIEEKIFKKYTVDLKKIEKFQSTKKDKYIFEKLFMNNQFKAIVEISKNGTLKGKVVDTENNEEFLPLKTDNQGAFIGEVRDTYEKFLIEIRNKYFIKNYFVSPQANRIATEIEKKYGDNPIFMWEKFPDFGVFKNSKNDKWYGIIMNIERKKLEENAKENVDIINLKLDKNEITELLNKKGFYPAWHMNKKYWITIILDETFSDKKIIEYIEKSHQLCK